MSLFSRGGNGPTSALRRHMICPRTHAMTLSMSLFSCVLCTLLALWVPHVHVWCRGKLEHAQRTDYVSLENNQKSSKNLKSTMYILKADDTARISRCFPGAEPERGHMHDMGSLSVACNALLDLPIRIHKPGSPLSGFWMLNGASKTLHTAKSVVVSEFVSYIVMSAHSFFSLHSSFPLTSLWDASEEAWLCCVAISSELKCFILEAHRK